MMAGLKRKTFWLVFTNTFLATLTSILAAGIGTYVARGDLATAILTAGAVPIAVAPWMTWMTLRSLSGGDQTRDELESLVRTDPMTGILNRRGFAERAQPMCAAARRGRMLCALVLDLDHFKDINDGFGHAAGDTVLTEIAQRLTATLRATDVVARLGGEEFAALLPRTPFEEALDVAERLRAIVGQYEVLHEGRILRVSTSVGVAEYDSGDTCVEDMLRRADAALYEAKAAGRNRVSAAPSSSARGPGVARAA